MTSIKGASPKTSFPSEMRFSYAFALVLAAGCRASSVVSSLNHWPRPPPQSLEDWFTSSVHSFFPNTTSWPKGYAQAFSRKVVITSNATKYNYTGLFDFYTHIESFIKSKYSRLEIDFEAITTVQNPNDLGGFVVAIAKEHGTLLTGGAVTPIPDGWYAVVSEEAGKRKITEYRQINPSSP